MVITERSLAAMAEVVATVEVVATAGMLAVVASLAVVAAVATLVVWWDTSMLEQQTATPTPRVL